MAKIVFIHSECESLGIEYLSAYLRARGHTTKLILDPRLFDTELTPNKFLAGIFSYHDIIIRQVLAEAPDIICMSVFSDNYCWAKEIAHNIKIARNIPVIFGGIHPTIVPECVIKEDCVDYVCVGEGEQALCELVEAITEHKDTLNIPNIWAKKNNQIFSNPPRNLINNLDDLPIPDKKLFADVFPEMIKGYKIITSRGCPFQCSYCAHHCVQSLYRGKGSIIRRRSVENVILELEFAKKTYGMKIVRFFDDVFTLDIKWLKKFSKEYKQRINLPYFCFIHPNAISAEHLKLLEESNCQTVFMGFGTYSPKQRESVLRRYYSNDQVAKIIDMIAATKIFLLVDCILGLPGQSTEEVLKMADFFNKHRPDALSVLFLRYYPETMITLKAEQDGLLTEGDMQKISHCGFQERIIIAQKLFNTLKKIESMMLIAQILPKRLVGFMHKHKWYRVFPDKDLNNLSVIISSCLPNIKGKRRIHTDTVSVGSYLRFYLKFMFGKIKFKISLINKLIFFKSDYNLSKNQAGL